MTIGLLVAALIVSTILVPAAIACNCREQSPAKAFREASAIFRGTVISIRHLNPEFRTNLSTGQTEIAPPSKDDQQEVTFLVDSIWKGLISPEIRVLATARAAMCGGYEFHAGIEYVVYATETPRSDWHRTLESLSLQMGLGPYPDTPLSAVEVKECPVRIRKDVIEESKLLGPPKPPARP